MTSSLNLKQTIACLEVSSVALGYRILDQITKLESIKILEASPVGGGNFWIFAAGTPASFLALSSILKMSLDGVGENANATILDHEILEIHDQCLLEGLYSLSAERLNESLLVIEAESISAVLSAIHAVQTQHQMKIIEIKINRGSKSGAHAFLTGSRVESQLSAEMARTKLKLRMSRGYVEVVEEPNAIFRQQFNFSGEV